MKGFKIESVNKYVFVKIIASIYFTIILLSSCETSRNVFKKENQNIDHSFKGTYINPALKVDSSIEKPQYGSISSTTLLILLGIYSKNTSGTVDIRFIENRKLEINYTDSSIRKKKIINGVFKKGGYFQCYITKKVIQIPPFISIIYGRRQIDKLRIGVDQSGQLLIHNKYVSEGNILIFGAGVNYKKLYHFKPS